MRSAVFFLKHTSWELSSSSCLPNAVHDMLVVPMWFGSFSLQALKLWFFSTCRSFSLNMTYPFYIGALQSTFTFWKVSLKHFSTADQISCSAAYLGWACDGVACAWLGELRHWNTSWVISVVEGIVPLGGQPATWNVHIQSHSEKWEKWADFQIFRANGFKATWSFWHWPWACDGMWPRYC